jgi:hypothetical protein
MRRAHIEVQSKSLGTTPNRMTLGFPNFRDVAASAVLAVAAAFSVQPLSAGEPRAVIELFTSQGCSSCPAADRVIGELTRDPSLIAMSLAVDYWDYLGWKDTLALHGHSSRERAYAAARGDRDVYTPQVVVNGAVAVLGSDKAAIERAIAQTRKDAQPLSLPVTLEVAGDRLVAEVPDATGATRDAEVWLCPISGKVTVKVGRGENSGNTLSYYNVVREWVKLGDWHGKAQSFSVPLSEVAGKDVDSFAVLVQSGVATKPGLVLGAATAAAR